MPKSKPILIFIIVSVALHWWILSLPIFKRIQALEGNTAKTSPPTLVAYLDQTQPIIKPREKEKTQVQTTAESNSEDSNKLTQPPPPPSFLRGSPWSRRPIETSNFNPSTPIQQNPFIQIENILSEGIATSDLSPMECRRNTNANLFTCQNPNNKTSGEKIADALNRKATEANLDLPNCITLEMLQKKWHAKACHS
jgi:hypothetical protein